MQGSSVVFFGCGELALAGIGALRAAGAHLKAVVVPSNRAGHDVDIVAAAAGEHGVPVWVQPRRSLSGPFIAQLHGVAPDVVVVWSYSMILPAAVLAVPVRGAINVHGGLLPEYRGGHVMQWAILNGESETGVTLHYMDTGIDTGPIVAQRRFPITRLDDAASVRAKLSATGTLLLSEWWPAIAGGTAPRIAQDESRARYWRMRVAEDGLIDWTKSAEDVSRLIRALACNVPGAYAIIGGQAVSITHASVCPALTTNCGPGDLLSASPEGLRIATGDGDLMVSEVRVHGTTLRGTALLSVVPVSK